MTANAAQKQLRDQLLHRYDDREASAIAYALIEDLTGLSRADRLMHDPLLNQNQLNLLEIHRTGLMMGKPLQYVLGHAWFMGEKFFVNPSVLIPRPETEELVAWCLEHTTEQTAVLDIGTGSGCIAVMISKKRPGAKVTGIDVSADALAVALKNAEALGATVNWVQGNFLWPAIQDSLSAIPDLIISNPPYIPLKDKETMAPHVVDHEPHLALFVPNQDALMFYREIVHYASRKGVPEIFFETHYQLAGEVAALGERSGFKAEFRKDMAGLDRMVRLQMR